ncbi:MAG: Sec-independent protein translocase protein TatB [Gammaproteobacteria bacterium]|nr:Sec-independent protein translocase protein TatB [Gammaproteobacteria bacterium]
MSGASYQEFLLLLVIGLIVLGPKRLPEIANKIGGWVGQARRMTRVMRRQLEEELRFDETPSIKAPPEQDTDNNRNKETAVAAGSVAESAAESEDTATPVVEEHVPNDDDTFSPLHDEDASEHEKSA